MKPSKRFGFIVAPLAFISAISFFQVNSAWADAHHFNTWWKVIGGVFGLLAIWQLIIVARDGGGGNSTGAGAR